MNKSDKLSSLALANIEALANGEGGNCDNKSGYKKWDTKATGLGGIIGIGVSSQEFYDCCRQLREGYNPTGSCN